jgi:Rieske Fe-S protein
MVVATALSVTGVAALVEALARNDSPQQAYQLPTQTQTQTTSQTSSGSQSQQVTAPPGYVLIGSASALSGKTSAYFDHPTYGRSLLVNVSGTWKAFSSICTHAPCTVQYGGGSEIYCPCHGATFSTGDGSVLGGPAPYALPEYGVQILNGDLFVTQSTIN